MPPLSILRLISFSGRNILSTTAVARNLSTSSSRQNMDMTVTRWEMASFLNSELSSL